MAKVEIPYYLLPKLGLGTNFRCIFIDVELLDGRIYTNLVVKNNVYITGRSSDPGGEGYLLFSGIDIRDVRRRIFPFSHCRFP